MRVLEFTPDVPLEAGGGGAAGQRVRVAFSWQTNARRILTLYKAGVA